jgi:tetratricopeptide (TPR) repeat protein
MTSEASLSLSSERLRHISDPLLLAKLGPEGPVRSLLEDVVRSRLDADCEKALYLCNAAVKCARKRGDQAKLALAYLYKADLQARSGQLEPAINLASRARQILAMCGERYWRDCHNVMVAQLQLARLQAAQDPESAQLCYQEAGHICQKLEAENKETGRSKAAHLYEQILAEIQLALKDVSSVTKGQYAQQCFLNWIPILQSPNVPEVVIGASQVIDYVTTGEFKIEGRSYFLYPVDETIQHSLELEPGIVHFALPVPRDGWLVQTCKVQDYALVRYEKQITHEGLAVSWTKDEWIGGWFDRDVNTGRIRFVPSKDSVKIIGKKRLIGQGYVIGLLKPIV